MSCLEIFKTINSKYFYLIIVSPKAKEKELLESFPYKYRCSSSTLPTNSWPTNTFNTC